MVVESTRAIAGLDDARQCNTCDDIRNHRQVCGILSYFIMIEDAFVSSFASHNGSGSLG